MRKVTEVTTEQIREATSKGFVASLGYKSISDTQFDLWLVNERHRVADMATAKERERILELFKKELRESYSTGDDIIQDGLYYVIDLLKGENK